MLELVTFIAGWGLGFLFAAGMGLRLPHRRRRRPEQTEPWGM